MKKSIWYSHNVAFVILCCIIGSCQVSEEQLDKKAQKIHDRVFTIDTHCDTPMRLLRSDYNPGVRNDPHQRGGKVDFVRMKEGGLDAIFFAVFIGQGERTPEGNERAKNMALSVFEEIKKTLDEHSDLAQLALDPDDGYEIEKEGKRAIYIGIENGYPIGNDLSLIKKYYDLGARYITLCHSSNNDICDSSTDRQGPEYDGLSDFGEKVVQEMNRLGMIIDVSHISDDSFYDVIGLSTAPVIASHSCARAICDNPRNLDDAMLKKLAENGGVIQMCILSSYVKDPEPYPERDSAFAALREKYRSFSEMTEEEMNKARSEWNDLERQFPQKLATVSDVVDHIDHIVEVAGIDHVGIGTDFDGGGGVEDCFDVSEMGNITRELVRRGYTPKEIEKIWGGNFMRVFRQVQALGEEDT